VSPLRPTRVLHVVARMNVGGPATQVVALTEGLDGAGYRVAVATGRPGSGEAEHLGLRPAELRLRRVPGFGPAPHPTDDARALRALHRLVRRARPDLIHTHTAKAGVLGRLVARRAGIPVVHTFHGHLLHGYFGPLGTRATVAVERRLAPWTDVLIAVGKRVRDDLLAAGIGRVGQYEAIPPGVSAPPTVPRAEARARLAIAPQAEVIAAVGRLTSIKRPERLLDIAAMLRRQGRPVTVVLCGDGDLRTELAARSAREGLDVRFLGWREDVGTVYAAADAVVLSSDNEGMPVALIEAALCGRPVVATDVGGVSEVVDHGRTGFVVPPTAQDLVAGVQRLLADSELRARVGAAAVEHATQRFSTRALVDATVRVYERVTEHRTASNDGLK
jgi:glycosyltransferase involved in cell wall biosynthesis